VSLTSRRQFLPNPLRKEQALAFPFRWGGVTSGTMNNGFTLVISTPKSSQAINKNQNEKVEQFNKSGLHKLLVAV
jgi:hypothetical protein